MSFFSGPRSDHRGLLPLLATLHLNSQLLMKRIIVCCDGYAKDKYRIGPANIVVSRTSQNGTVLVDPKGYTNVLVRRFYSSLSYTEGRTHHFPEALQVNRSTVCDMHPNSQYALKYAVAMTERAHRSRKLCSTNKESCRIRSKSRDR